MGQALKRTFDKLFRGKLKIGDRRKAYRNSTDFRRRAYDPA
jgi:hypothetical protein